jgi:hypothetical protein
LTVKISLEMFLISLVVIQHKVNCIAVGNKPQNDVPDVSAISLHQEQDRQIIDIG